MCVIFITSHLSSEVLKKTFVTEATPQQGMIDLKGHRPVGGIRASVNNAMRNDGGRALAEFMFPKRKCVGSRILGILI